MKHLLIIFFILFCILLVSCSKRSSGSTVKVVKPKYHHRWFDRRKDKRATRTRTVRMIN